MPATASSAAPPSGIPDPYGSYKVWPTDLGIAFQIGVRDPRNNIAAALLVAKTLGIGWLTYSGFWSCLGLLILLLALDGLLYFCLYSWLGGSKLIWIEVRPDGIVITFDPDDRSSERFFQRPAITRRELDFDHGLQFRFGIHDIGTPGFADEREFEVFQAHFEKAIARLWHIENLDQ
jgi:hypothetical protein